MDVRTLLPALLIAVPVPLSAQNIDPGQTDPMRVFRILDTDRNGLLSRYEVRLMPALTLQFQRLDRNRSGRLDAREFGAFEAAGGLEQVGGTEGIDFDVLDTDRNGRISRQEAGTFPPLAQQLSDYDADGNGYVDRDEFLAFEIALFDGSGYVPTSPAGQLTFDALDRDGNGSISPAEAVRSRALRQQWSALDRDGDDVLSPAEFSAFEKGSSGDKRERGGRP